MSTFVGTLRGQHVGPRNHRREVNRLAVACPECKAPAGTHCTSASGKKLTASHVSRVRIATRAYLAEYHPKAPASTALDLYRSDSKRHILGDDTTACGIRVRRAEAIRTSRLSTGPLADVNCAACRDAVRDAA